VDVKGGLNIKKLYGQQALTLFIQPPSVEELRKRLEGRATDAQEVIEQRLQKASYEMSFATQYDYIIINDELEKAIQETKTIIQAFLSR
jgi:guanylate kinase